MDWIGLERPSAKRQTPDLRRHPSHHLRTRCNVLRLEIKQAPAPAQRAGNGKAVTAAPTQADTQSRTQPRRLATITEQTKTRQRKTKQQAGRTRPYTSLVSDQAGRTRPYTNLAQVHASSLAELVGHDLAPAWPKCAPHPLPGCWDTTGHQPGPSACPIACQAVST